MTSTSSDQKQSLEKLWAERYIRSLAIYDWQDKLPTRKCVHLAEKLLNALRFASSQAWANTEALLAQEIPRQRIAANLIDPWQISLDSRILFEKAAESYKLQLTPAKFSVVISPECGRIREIYTSKDSRVLGFMSMQFHYTWQLLMETFDPGERILIGEYFKVIDDHLYMPLQRSYNAAANHAADSEVLLAVQHLLPLCTTIAEYICAEVAGRYPDYQCHSGSLHNTMVRTSSIRDVEMFQIYLCLCALESDISSVQQELFPLCVMLYPPLNVKWQLVQQLLHLLEQELCKRLTSNDYNVFAHYMQALQDMFSPAVLSDASPMWSYNPETAKQPIATTG